MTIQELGSISELIAAIATVATLGYLAVQIKHNKASVNSSNVQHAVGSFNPLNMALGGDASLARLVNRGVVDFASLNEEERAQYGWVQRAYLNCFFNVFLQHKIGAMSTEQWLPYAHEVAFLLDNPGPRAFRKSNRMYDEMFEAVEAMQLEGDRLDLDLTSGSASSDEPAA
jgi:hypothetical protein